MDVIIDFHFNKKTMEKLNFGQAIEALKNGQRIQREGWNGKGMHVYLESHFKFVAGNHEREYPPVLVLFTANGLHQAGWNASTPDLLAEDWSVVEVP